MSEKLRIGAVSYLNTKPLVYDLPARLPAAELSLDYPSRLADALEAGTLDVALVPVVELLQHPEWIPVSNACISSRGPVLSVKLLFRVPPAEVRTLALDEGSRTSVMLAQVLLRELHQVEPQLSAFPLGVELSDITSDAVLMIGDRAMRVADEQFVEVWDLGDRWCRWSELPFVFARWVSRAELPLHVAAAFESARDAGLRQVEQISSEQALKMDLPEPLVSSYLSQNLNFTLGHREQRGMELFFERVRAWNLCSAGV